MVMDDSIDVMRNGDWKSVGNANASESAAPVTRKRLPKKIRQVPEYYFLPRRSLPSAIAIYGAVIAAGVGAGMLAEVWVNKTIKGVLSFYLDLLTRMDCSLVSNTACNPSS